MAAFSGAPSSFEVSQAFGIRYWLRGLTRPPLVKTRKTGPTRWVWDMFERPGVEVSFLLRIVVVWLAKRRSVPMRMLGIAE